MQYSQTWTIPWFRSCASSDNISTEIFSHTWTRLHYFRLTRAFLSTGLQEDIINLWVSLCQSSQTKVTSQKSLSDWSCCQSLMNGNNMKFKELFSSVVLPPNITVGGTLSWTAHTCSSRYSPFLKSFLQTSQSVNLLKTISNYPGTLLHYVKSPLFTPDYRETLHHSENEPFTDSYHVLHQILNPLKTFHAIFTNVSQFLIYLKCFIRY